MVRIEQWAVGHYYMDPYAAPETPKAQIKCIMGEVYDHPNPRFHDGKSIKTSGIVKTDKHARTVTTESGSVYLLGEPNPGWITWLKENGHELEDPFPHFV